jgi:hypothetical protein
MAKEDYWFPARTFGWGWGLPVKWQGWVVYGVALALLVAIHFVFPPAKHLELFLCSFLGVILLLVAVCWLKGEPPRWRWGK